MFNNRNQKIRHIGAISVLSLLGIVGALIPVSLYSSYIGEMPQSPLVWLAAAFSGGAVIGWVLKR